MTQYDANYLEWKNWGEENFAQLSLQDRLYFEKEVFSRCQLPQNASLLEIGYGKGSLLGLAKEKGLTPYGTEINPELIRIAQNKGFKVSSSVDQLPKNHFDVAVAFDLIEHIPQNEIEKLLASIRDALKPGGTLVLRFPNGDSPFGRIFQHGDVTHLTTLGRYKIEYFAKLVGLKLEFIGNPARVYPDSGVLKSLKRFVGYALKAFIEKTLGKLYFGVRIPLDPHMIAVLKK